MATIQSPPRKRSSFRRALRGLFIFTGVPYAGIIVLMTILQRSLIYGPIHDEGLNVRPAQIAGATTEPVRLTTADNLQLNGWHLVADAADGGTGDEEREWTHGRPLILYFCGNAANRAHRAEEFQLFAELGADTICFDYRGYGDNGGSPGETAFAADARATWRYVTEERGIDPGRIILFGESLGGGVATRLASDLSAAGTPPGGLVLRSTFTRLADAAAWHFPWLPVRWLLLDRFSSVDCIGQVTCRILIMHGRRDMIIPFEEGEALYTAAPEKSLQGIPPAFIELQRADHNDILLVERDAFRLGMQNFLHSINPPVVKMQLPRENSRFARFARKRTYSPVHADNLSPERLQLPANRIHAIALRTDDGLTLNGWHLLADGCSAADRAECDRELLAGRPLALYFPGNGGHRGDRIAEAGHLTRTGADVILFDYRGYGDNPGTPTEEAFAADARAVWRYATKERRVPPGRILLYGESIGGAVATRLACDLCNGGTPPAGLLIRSTSSCLADAARLRYPYLPKKLLPAERYAAVEQITSVTCPLMVLHGEQDQIIPHSLGRKVFDAAPGKSMDGTPKQFIDLPHSDHDGVVETDGDLLEAAVHEFVQRIFPERRRKSERDAEDIPE